MRRVSELSTSQTGTAVSTLDKKQSTHTSESFADDEFF